MHARLMVKVVVLVLADMRAGALEVMHGGLRRRAEGIDMQTGI